MDDDESSNILLVDDEPDILESLKDLFEMELQATTIDTAVSGPDALDMLGQKSYDLIITDYKMPEMDGLQFLRRVRETAPDIPCVMMTAFPDLTIAIDAINDASVENFFVKPLDPTDIVKQVRGMLEARAVKLQRVRALARAAAQRDSAAPMQEGAHE